MIAYIAAAGANPSFGELALMYNAPRAATVKASSDCKLWALDRLAFKVIMMETAASKNSTRSEFLGQVKIMETLSDMERRTIADALVAQQFNAGDIIIRQGDPGTGFSNGGLVFKPTRG